MSDFTQTIQDIEEEIRKTPYHKGTEHHIGKLRARLARLKDKQIEAEFKKSGGGGGGYAVKKTGDATVVLIGPPSVGKSTLINQLTNTQSKVAEYAFTTLGVIPGMLFFKDAYIQILDIPGIIQGAKEGKGRGREVLSVARNADLLLLMCDVNNFAKFELLEKELEAAGIRINQVPSAITIKKKPDGGINILSNLKQTFDLETLTDVAREMGVKNADIVLKEKVTLEGLIDACSTNRIYLPAVYVINKIDTAQKGKKYEDSYQPISAAKGIGLERLKEQIWEKLSLVRIYLVHPGEEPSFQNPILVKKGQSLKDVCLKIGEDFATDKKSAKIWGTGARFPGQEVSLSSLVAEGMQIRFV